MGVIMLTTDLFFFHAGAISNAPTINTPPVTSSAISHFCTYLKAMYKNSPVSPDSKWPPTPSKKYISLTVVEGDGHMCHDEYIGHALEGKIAAGKRKKIFIEQILEAEGQENLKLVLVEGAPGIGKSTLAWELCRKWEEFSCMQQYSLVILLRLREEEVQKIANINQLFFSCDGETIAREMSANHGRSMLFILDGFDELPKPLQHKGFLLDLIKRKVVPESTVLVTSRPSATGELLTSCRPLIQKHVEVLGFTQDSVEAYATSIFSSEPEKLEKFIAYISASMNPAINSLMYVPLNAAIIVEIYRNCKSEHLLPHTLTELYTQLCLTILNRHFKIQNPLLSFEKFEDLPADSYQQFLDLSKTAFEGFKKEEIILHTAPSNMVHFGFLDSVSALYGGGGVSYNFLHLTVQEFFAAYHISHLGSSGLEVFQQYGKAKRWNVVWRFVAGLTKFMYYKGHIDRRIFFERSEFSIFLPQCLFEAQSVNCFSVVFNSLTTASIKVRSPTALDAYAIGYCIANFPIGVPWDVEIEYGDHHSFTCGLNTKMPSEGVINKLFLDHCHIVFTDLKSNHLRDTTTLYLIDCDPTDTDMVHLSELIPHLPCLKEFGMYSLENKGLVDIPQDGSLKVLRQLKYSNVSSLNIYGTHVVNHSRDHFRALKRLIDPTFGKIKHLVVQDYAIVRELDTVHNNQMELLSTPSSLKSLDLLTDNLLLYELHLKNNTCLTRLELYLVYVSDITSVINIVNQNRTLEKLSLDGFSPQDTEEVLDAVRQLVRALYGNCTLQKVVLSIGGFTEEAASRYVTTHYKELTLDRRIEYMKDHCPHYYELQDTL